MTIVVIILSIMIWIGYTMIHTQGREIATLQRQLSELQDSTLKFSNNMNAYISNQNEINRMHTERIKGGY